MKKIAILQSNYIPWKGYFDMIAAVDEFVLYDDAQFTKNDWRNRNQIKTPHGIQWLSVPVGQDISRKIRDVELPKNKWQIKHWKTLEGNYRRAPYFAEIASVLEPLYYADTCTHLSEINRRLIEAVCNYLGIKTKISNSWDYQLLDGQTERLAGICAQAGADEYISGPAANDYIEEDVFAKQGVKVTWFDYSGYPPYPQQWGEFVHSVSILDLLFNCGTTAHLYMKYVGKP